MRSKLSGPVRIDGYHFLPAFFVLLVILSVPAWAQQEPKPTRWMDPSGLPKPRHAVPVPSRPFIMYRFDIEAGVQEKTVPTPPSLQGRICLVVGDTIYDAISTKLLLYIQDLENEGYSVTVYRFVSGSAEDIRSFLLGLYNEQDSLTGAVLIGDIPYIIYEMMQDWDGSGVDPPEYEDFPCDIFYMDLDGVWSDVLEDMDVHAGNGKYDTRSGSTDLEIWACRLKTGNLTALGTEADILNDYFDKARNYRTGTLSPSPSALAYDDDDWSNMGPGDSTNLQGVYGLSSVVLVNDPESTTASDYKANQMPVNQELIFTRSHGYPGGHGYYRSNRAVFDWVFASDYLSVDPPALFYSFFVCSGCDYTANNYLGGTAAFNENSGLLTWGSTKTGGMWVDSQFYSPLANGDCFGAAFANWFDYVQSNYSSYAPRWWYGMVLIGDASLRPSPGTVHLAMAVDPAGGGTTIPVEGTTTTVGIGVSREITATAAEGYEFDHWSIEPAAGGTIGDTGAELTTVTLTDDATVTAHMVALEIKGDFNGDGYIDYNDLFEFVACWHTGSGEANYDTIADFDDSGYIDYEDLFAFVAIWHTYP